MLQLADTQHFIAYGLLSCNIVVALLVLSWPPMGIMMYSYGWSDGGSEPIPPPVPPPLLGMSPVSC